MFTNLAIVWGPHSAWILLVMLVGFINHMNTIVTIGICVSHMRTMVLVYLPTFTRTKSATYVGKYTSIMEHMGIINTVNISKMFRFPGTQDCLEKCVTIPVTHQDVQQGNTMACNLLRCLKVGVCSPENMPKVDAEFIYIYTRSILHGYFNPN